MPSFTSKRARILLAVGVVFIFLFLVSRTSFQMLLFGACACDSCVAELGQDPWFRQRYNPSVRLLLTKWNWELSDDLYGWWQKLQRKSQGNYKAVVGTLFSIFVNDHDPLDAGPGRCRRCAVVGNSGNLKRSRYGPLIDAHDLVIRINQGPTEGFEKDVGFRTTHRIIYPESAVDLDNSTHLVLVPFKVLDLQWLISIFTTKHISRTYVPVKRTIKASKDRVMILHPVFLKYIRDQWLLKHGRYPSTGFVSIILALHMCDQVSVFGFGADGKGNWHHYFEETKEPKDVVNHDRGYEHRLTLQLHQKRRITLYTGW